MTLIFFSSMLEVIMVSLERDGIGHLPERHQLLSSLVVEEVRLNEALLAVKSGEELSILVYSIPEVLTKVRLTRARVEKRFDFKLTRQEINDAPPVISDLFDELGIEEGDDVHSGVVLPYWGKPNEEYFHFAWVVSPDLRLPNRVGLSMPSDEQLPVFMMTAGGANGRAQLVRTDFVENGAFGCHDLRVEVILLEAARWLPEVIQSRVA